MICVGKEFKHLRPFVFITRQPAKSQHPNDGVIDLHLLVFLLLSVSISRKVFCEDFCKTLDARGRGMSLGELTTKLFFS